LRLIRLALGKLPFFGLLLGLAALPAQAAPTKILVFGDSLVSGYGLKPNEAFPPMLGMRLHADGYDVLIANGGVPGETTTLAFARLEAALESRPDLVILELGANDMLNNLPLKTTRENLKKMLLAFRQVGAHVILAGMVAKSDLPIAYRRRFDALYPELARSYATALYPYFLEGVGGNPALTQEGGLHPNAKGVQTIVGHIAPLVERTLAQMGVKPRRSSLIGE
jgi:acyl-CoA thioesterase-1